MAGAPFFFGEADAEALGFGVSLGSGVAVALSEGDGLSPGDGLGVGEPFRFFFLPETVDDVSGDGLGDDFFFFDEAEGLGDGVSTGVGVAPDFFFFGEGDFSDDEDFSGVAVGLAAGDFSALDFFLVRLRGAGVGVGLKIFFSFVPSDSSAGAIGARSAMEARIAKIIRAGRMASDSSTSAPEMEPARAWDRHDLVPLAPSAFLSTA